MNILFFRSKKILKKSIGTKLFSFGLALIIFSGIHWYFEASVALAKNEAQTSASSIEFQQIALMPFLKGSFESPDGPVDKPLSRQLSQITLEKQYLREDADRVLTRLVAKALETRFGEKLVPVEKALSIFQKTILWIPLENLQKLLAISFKPNSSSSAVFGAIMTAIPSRICRISKHPLHLSSIWLNPPQDNACGGRNSAKHRRR